MPEIDQDLSNFDKRLAIIIPYRDREEHLKIIIPHLQAYFQRDKIDKNIPYAIHVVE